VKALKNTGLLFEDSQNAVPQTMLIFLYSHDHRHSRWLDNVNRSKRLTLQGLLTLTVYLNKFSCSILWSSFSCDLI
jgi:hypothetical protein